CSGSVRQRLMLALIEEHIDAPIGSATTNTTTAVRLAVTIQHTSGSATTDFGGITDSLTRRGGHAEEEAHQQVRSPALRRSNVRFGSLADICAAKNHVRFTPDSDRKSGLPQPAVAALPRKPTCASQKVMSALGQKRTLPPYSITSSARASKVGGTSIPSVRAACRLRVNSNLVDCNTGRSAGLVPLRMLPVYTPTWRKTSARLVP